MKHWRPDDSAAVPLDAYPRRRARRDWTSVADYAPPRARPQQAREARLGGWIGLGLVALLCAALVLGAGAILAGPDPIDRLAVEP